MTMRTLAHLSLAFVALFSIGGCKKSTPVAPAPDAVAAPTDTEPAAADAAPAPNSDAAAAPSDAGAPAPGDWNDPAFRATRPAPAEATPLALPTIEPWKLANGLTVYQVPGTLPTASLTFEFDLGGIDDPADAQGLASVCLDLFSEGTERLDKVAWSEALADHAVSIYSPAGAETSAIVVRSLESQLGPALDLFAELVRSPGMRKDDLARILDDRRAALAQARATPAGIAGRLFGSLVWGADHPYGRVEQLSHLDNITLDACRTFVAQLKPDGARLWVVGSVNRERLEADLSSRLGEWTGKAPTKRELAPAIAPNGKIHAVHVPGAVQSVVVIGHPGPARDAADYEATQMLAMIFGGSFSSRVNMNLREDKGYAYGARGGFTYRRAGSHLSVSASVEVSTTALSLVEIAKEIKMMRAEAPKADELTRERDGALQALPARFAKPSSTLEELRSLHYFGLPFDWYAAHEKRLAAVTTEAVFEASKQHLAPGDLVVLVVGDLEAKTKDDPTKTVRQALDKLAEDKLFGPGGLVVLDPDGKVL